MKKQQSGFTLIELVVVIVILGILAATAVPRFVDLTGDAEAATAQGIAGALASSAVLLYAENKAPTSLSSIEDNANIDATSAGGYSLSPGSCTASGETTVTVTVGGGTGTTTLPSELCNS